MNNFKEETEARIRANGSNVQLQSAAKEFLIKSIQDQYSYNFSWMGRPIIQYPQDIVAIQELVWSVKPDLIIETGIAHGGSLILSAALLAQLDLCEAIDRRETLEPWRSSRRVLGIDIDIRAHNRKAIEAHPLYSRIELIQGSSVDPAVIAQVRSFAADFKKVMVCLDSNHTHDHVLRELEAYAPLTSVDSYCVVFDTMVEDVPGDLYPDRPWSPGNNPKTAVWEFLKSHSEFEIDKSIQNKLLITVAPDGYLKRCR